MKIWAAPAPAPGKTPRWLEVKCTDSVPRLHKRAGSDENEFFRSFDVANFVRFIHHSEQKTHYL